jgi:predicted thioredoxin/glutaredoxin
MNKIERELEKDKKIDELYSMVLAIGDKIGIFSINDGVRELLAPEVLSLAIAADAKAQKKKVEKQLKEIEKLKNDSSKGEDEK